MVRGFAPGSIKFVAAIALSRTKKLESGNLPFIRFGIQLYHAFLKTVLLRQGQLHHAEDDVPGSQAEDSGDETNHTVVASNDMGLM